MPLQAGLEHIWIGAAPATCQL